MVAVLAWALAAWLISPRFAIDGPSLVDDWVAVTRSPDQISDVLRFTNPEEQRFRPGWILWNYLQWHTLDAPNGLTGPNIWNLARLAILVAGLSLLTAVMLPRPRDRRGAVILAGLAGLPAVLVVAVPKFARDVAWFGPQEPLLLGGMALGGALLALAARRLLDPAVSSHWRIAGLGVTGGVLWVLGTYQKEVSLSAIPLLLAALVVGRGRLAGWPLLSSRRRAALIALGAVVVVPLLHVLVEVARITARGDLVYDAEVDRGAGVVRGLRVLYDWSHEALPLQARQLMVGAVVLVALATLVRRRIDALALGTLAAGGLTVVFAAQSGVAVSRYYLPVFALFAVALSLTLARFPQLVQTTGALLVFFAFMPPTEARNEVRTWSEEERQGTALVQAVAELERSECRVAMAGLDLETSEAIPVLVGLADGGLRACVEGGAYLVVGPNVEGVALSRICAEDRLESLVLGPRAGLYACERLRSQPIRDERSRLVEPEELLDRHRFRSVSS